MKGFFETIVFFNKAMSEINIAIQRWNTRLITCLYCTVFITCNPLRVRVKVSHVLEDNQKILLAAEEEGHPTSDAKC